MHTCQNSGTLPNMASFFDARGDHGARASAARSLADLPEEVLLVVMERIPLTARLRCCSLVCRSMQKAAAAATLSIKVPSCRPTAAASADRSASLQLYLQHYGHQLTSISMEKEALCFPDQSLQGPEQGNQQQQRLLTLLSCSRLQELVLSGGRLQPAVLHAPAAALTKLILQSSAARPVQLVRSPTAGQTGRWYSTPGVVLYDEWSEGSESDAESDGAGDPAESVDEGAPSSLQASSSPLGQQFHKALQHLSGLKHLQLDYCSDGTRATMFGKALPYLTRLTHLKVWWYCVAFKPWCQHLSCLTDLHALALYTNMEQSQGFVEDLGQHSLLADEVLEGVQHLQRLTELRVEGLCLAVTAHSSSTLGRLTGLQVLQLSYASCDLSALADITGLRSLSLQHWEPCFKVRDDAPERFQRPEPVSQQQLQATLLQLQHLTYFGIAAASVVPDDEMSRCTLEAVDNHWELAPAPWSHYHFPIVCASSGRSDECEACKDAEQSIVGFNAAEIGASLTPQPGMEVFAAFTASSCLQHLDLSNAVLQFHTWQHIFPAGRTLLQLTCLQAPYALYSPGDYDDPAEGDLALTDADVAAMVSCCPALQALEATKVLQLSDKPHLGTLQHLTCLEAIWGGDIYTVTLWDSYWEGEHVDVWDGVDKAAAARELSRLTNLRQLKLRGESHWGEDLFRALQHLSHLSSLCLSGTCISTSSNRGREVMSVGEAGLIAHLTGLQELDVRVCLLPEAQLLQLASLPQLTRLRFSPAPGRDMGKLFEEAVKSFKGGSAGSDMQHLQYMACVIESKECCSGPCDILHQLVQQLAKVYQQQETTGQGLTNLRSTAAQQQKELHKNKTKLAQLVQELSHIKSFAAQQERERNAAVEAAAEHQKQLQEKDQQLAQLHQQLAELKASAEQRDAAAR